MVKEVNVTIWLLYTVYTDQMITVHSTNTEKYWVSMFLKVREHKHRVFEALPLTNRGTVGSNLRNLTSLHLGFLIYKTIILVAPSMEFLKESTVLIVPGRCYVFSITNFLCTCNQRTLILPLKLNKSAYRFLDTYCQVQCLWCHLHSPMWTMSGFSFSLCFLSVMVFISS